MSGRKTFSQCGWIAGLYLAEGLPNVLATVVATVAFLNLGMDKGAVILWTSLFGLPWVLKPLWSPVVDLYATRRRWIVGCQFLLGALLAAIGVLLASPFTQIAGVLLFFAVAAVSATHDAAADGFYIAALSEHEQAFFSGIRSAFYKLSVIIGQGGFVIVAGFLMKYVSVQLGWLCAFLLAGGAMCGLALFCRVFLPVPANDCGAGKPEAGKPVRGPFFAVFLDFFRWKDIGKLIFVLLFFRFAESQLRVAVPFLLDAKANGGLALSTAQQGMIYGTSGMIALTLGGIAGGVLVSRDGIGKWLFPMACAINLPDAVYVYLAFFPDTGLWGIATAVFVEQFGYGFGLTGMMMLMVSFATRRNCNQSTFYAIMTGIMYLGLMLPGMFSGYLLDALPGWFGRFVSGGKYPLFFLWVMACTIPSFFAAVVAARIVPSSYGRRGQ